MGRGSKQNFFQRRPTDGDFPGGPAVKIPCSQCRGPGFDPWSGNYIPHAATKIPHATMKTPSVATKTSTAK